ncbi:hypothetical protein ACSBR1_012657 [Camellia fascicularis]
MAKSTVAQLLVLLLLAIFITSEARILRERYFSTQKNINNELLLCHLGFDPSKFKLVIGNYQRLSLTANSDRVAPGGPDPQHHSLPPAFN